MENYLHKGRGSEEKKWGEPRTSALSDAKISMCRKIGYKVCARVILYNNIIL
jgi:hypothetical protein